MIFFFFTFFYTATTFTDFDTDMLGHNRYIVDIDRFFSIFFSINCRLLISCREGPTPEISTIYRDIFVHGRNYKQHEMETHVTSTNEITITTIPKYFPIIQTKKKKKMKPALQFPRRPPLLQILLSSSISSLEHLQPILYFFSFSHFS